MRSGGGLAKEVAGATERGVEYVQEAKARGVVTGGPCLVRHGKVQGDSGPSLGGLGVGGFPEALTKQLPSFASRTSERTWLCFSSR